MSPNPPPKPFSPPSFREVYANEAAFVWRTVRRLGVPEADLEDVCQEVFVTLHRRLSAFEGRSALRTWIFGICQRIVSDYRQRAHIRREEPYAEPPDQEISGDQLKSLETYQARQILDDILNELDDSKRAAFVLFELEGWSMNDVAVAMDCPLQTAYARLYAARKLVEQAIAKRREGGGRDE